MKKRILSAIQPTSEMHLGNYFGAVKNWVDLQEEYQGIYGVADLHAMTMPYSPEILRQNSMNMAVDLLACGINPEKSIIFIQSLLPEHVELFWILSCVSSYGQLTRMTQFKDKTSQLEETEKEGFIPLGLFSYPVLQAADILLYKPEFVPVGKDQEQHLELSREIANSFNSRFGSYFSEPKALFTETLKLLSLADPTKKMSKSLGEKHFISLFEAEDSIRQKVSRAVTDSGEKTEGMSAGVANLFELLKATESLELESLMEDYSRQKLRYVSLKQAVADSVVKLTSHFIEKRRELNSDRKKAENIIRESTERARGLAHQTLGEVREIVGLVKK